MNSGKKIILINEEKCTGCLICQMRCSFIYHKEFNPTKAYIQIDLTEIFPIIQFLDGCSKCGQCVDSCLYGALEIKEEDI